MKVLVADKVSAEGLEILEQADGVEVEVKTGLSEDELAAAVAGADGLVIRSGAKVTRKVIEAADKLRVIGRAGVGVDNVDLDAATEKGIVVMNTPDGNTIAAAEHTVGLIVSLARNIPQADRSLKEGRWDRSLYVGSELQGKTLGVVGLGRIGSHVARVAQSLRMKVIAFDPYYPAERAAENDIGLVELDALFENADIITLHVPATEETKGMVNAARLAKMKNSALLVNCARGALVDEAALLDALKAGKIAGAALDVYSKEPPECRELVEHERVVSTPHLGASTREAQINVGVQIARQIIAALKGGACDNAVNLPLTDTGVLERFGRFIELTERIGVFAAQFIDGAIEKVTLALAGECRDAAEPLKLAVLKGILTPATGGNVNFVNAPYLARSRGIKVESTLTESDDYTNLVIVSVKTQKESCRMDGTVFGEELPRIVRINEFFMDVNPRGHLLALKNQDVPGVIGQVGGILGDAGINIGEYRLGREETNKNTLSLVSTDTAASDVVVEKLRKVKGMQLVKRMYVP
ncbi:MAG: phosphoglycerate dehydrogenase [Candidatus Glassbacteria bacterium]|nr:phosphoglycerate dehydrogenase [Candidatus Glassbacteria bacterium]